MNILYKSQDNVEHNDDVTPEMQSIRPKRGWAYQQERLIKRARQEMNDARDN
jgi:hypothetical protein